MPPAARQGEKAKKLTQSGRKVPALGRLILFIFGQLCA